MSFPQVGHTRAFIGIGEVHNGQTLVGGIGWIFSNFVVPTWELLKAF